MKAGLLLAWFVLLVGCSNVPRITETPLRVGTTVVAPTPIATESVPVIPTRRIPRTAIPPTETSLHTSTPDPRYRTEACQPGQKFVDRGWPSVDWQDATPPAPSGPSWAVFRSERGILYYTDDWWGYSFEQGRTRFLFEHPAGWAWNGSTVWHGDGLKVLEITGPICMKTGQNCFDNAMESETRQEYYQSGAWNLLEQEDWMGGRNSGRIIVDRINAVDKKNHPRFGTGHVPDVIYWVEYCVQDENRALVLWFWKEDELRQSDLDLFKHVADSVRFFDP